MQCLGTESVALYVAGGLSPGLRVRVDSHIDRCPACRKWIADAARMATGRDGSSTAPSDPIPPWPAPGTTIGRYVVRDLVGRGAMGVVLRADDPVLDRPVALKVLHRVFDDEVGRAALLSEARSLARISDPNVVQIFDTATWCDRFVIAMELVEGTSLRRVVESGRASRSERLRMLLGAGRGLVAAHTAGIVHRDFKPDNVLIATDGRILVGDFGLARLDDPDHTRDVNDEGLVVGTPAYMPPEQRAAGSLDARADQFAFCVTAVEVLIGVRPRAIECERDRELLLARTHALPRGLRQALVTGLAADPEQRAKTMEPLLVALERAAPRSSSPIVWTIPLLAPLALGLSLAFDPSQAVDPEPPTAPALRDPVGAGLSHAHRGASVALYAKGDIRGAHALADEAVGVAEAGGDPSPLIEALAERALLVAHEGDIGQAIVDYERAYDVARRHRLDDRAARLALGVARMTSRDPARIEAAFDWLNLAEKSAESPVRRARIASTRGRIELDRRNHTEAAAQCSAAIAALVERDVAPSEELAALLEGADRPTDPTERHAALGIIDDICAVWCSTGRCRDAVIASRYVVDQLVVEFGEAHTETAIARVNVASLLGRTGDTAGAGIELERAIAALERDPKADPTALAVATQNLALSLYSSGDRRRGHEVALLAVSRTQDVFGASSPELVRPICSLARFEVALGDPEGARRHLEWALVTAEQAFGPDHELTATVHLELAELARSEGDRSRARAHAERMLAVYDRKTRPSEMRARAMGAHAWSLLPTDPARARKLLSEALALLDDLRAIDLADPLLTTEVEAIAARTLAEAEYRLAEHERANALRARAMALVAALDSADATLAELVASPLGALP